MDTAASVTLAYLRNKIKNNYSELSSKEIHAITVVIAMAEKDAKEVNEE